MTLGGIKAEVLITTAVTHLGIIGLIPSIINVDVHPIKHVKRKTMSNVLLCLFLYDCSFVTRIAVNTRRSDATGIYCLSLNIT